MAKKRTKPTTIATETTSEIAASIFSESLSAIRAEIRGIVDKSIKPKEHDSASRIAWLAKNAASVAAEQRKAEAGELAGIRKLSPRVVQLWIKEQTPEYRARFVREVIAIDTQERKSVLG